MAFDFFTKGKAVKCSNACPAEEEEKSGGMLLILMRHAEAAPSAGSDALRPLTALGSAQARDFGRFCSQKGLELSSIWHSPLVRTTQTAALVAETLNPALPLQGEPDLAPGVSFDLADKLRIHTGGNLLCVFHAPDVNMVAALLLNRPTSAMPFAPATAMALEIQDDGIKLLWHLSHEEYRKSITT